MDAILQLVLQNLKIAYVITDRNLNILKTNGVLDLIGSDGHMKLSPGQSLLDFVPELIGNEPILAEILAGKRRRFQLNQINREITPNNINYLTLIILPFMR